MHLTLHLTTGCTSRCSYCYAPPGERRDMDEATARQAVEFARALSPINSGIIFFGGEPLLRKELIRSTVAHCQALQAAKECYFHFKVTTNGLLLDSQFLDYADSVGLVVALSHDGVREANDLHRRTHQGEGTFDLLEEKTALLLAHQPYAPVFLTVTPETVGYYAQSVDYLFERGFRYLVASLNYAAAWDKKALGELARQYRALAAWYETQTLAEKKFYFSPFETKFASHIRGEDAKCQRCQLGVRQLSVAHDGTLYPCVQFVQDGESNRGYAVGDVWRGIDERRRGRLYEMSRVADPACEACALRTRCNCDCGCLNWQTTGQVNRVAGVLCDCERMLISIVDALGERLFRQRAPMFIQKHYNAVYPLLSMIEDGEDGVSEFKGFRV